MSALDGVGDGAKMVLELLQHAAEMCGECAVRLAARLFQHHALFSVSRTAAATAKAFGKNVS